MELKLLLSPDRIVRLPFGIVGLSGEQAAATAHNIILQTFKSHHGLLLLLLLILLLPSNVPCIITSYSLVLLLNNDHPEMTLCG